MTIDEKLQGIKKVLNTDITDEKLTRLCVSAIYFSITETTEGLTKDAKLIDTWLKDLVKLYLKES